jgi:hypothetical protein
MAAITPEKADYIENKIVKIAWLNLTTTNYVGVGVRYPAYADKTVQLTGTLSGGTPIWTMEGSNDSTNGVDGTWGALKASDGNTVALNVIGEIDLIAPNSIWIRPNRVSGGDGSTSLNVYLLARNP